MVGNRPRGFRRLVDPQTARRMRPSEETFQAIAADNQVAPIADEKIIAFKLDQEFG
jgi:hypothetical protein